MVELEDYFKSATEQYDSTEISNMHASDLFYYMGVRHGL